MSFIKQSQETGNRNQPSLLPTSNSNTMIESYSVGLGGSAVRRIGTPHENDVLSGRGGAINSHTGNQRFREWVRVRRENYNLARSKAEKARIANEVMDLVRNQSPPGRFLQRDPTSSTMGVTRWVEVDEIKAMAKTSQALREGAPSIRAAHKDELEQGVVKKRTRRPKSKSSGTTTTASTGTKRRNSSNNATKALENTDVNSPMPPLSSLEMSKSQAMRQLQANVEAAVTNSEADANPPDVSYAPLMSTTDFENVFGRPPKRSRYSVGENLYLPTTSSIGSFSVTPPQPHIVKPDDAETPPLAPMPSPVPLSEIPELSPHGGSSNHTSPSYVSPPSMPKRETNFKRINSLALSDIGNNENDDAWGDLKFVNPFEGDNDDLSALSPPLPQGAPVRGTSTSKNGRGGRRSSWGSALSMSSELSDILDGTTKSRNAPNGDSEFGEGMKTVYDVVHPGLAGSSDEPIPTHLYPFNPTRQTSAQLIF